MTVMIHEDAGKTNLTRSGGRVFTATRPLNSDESATFSFDDDAWELLNLLRPHERRGLAKINFAALPEWMRRDAKQYIEHLWLRAGTPLTYIQRLAHSLRHLDKALPEFAKEFGELKNHHAWQASDYIAALKSSHQHRASVCRHINDFAAFVRQQHPEGRKNNFRIELPRNSQPSQKLPLGQEPRTKIAVDVLAMIIDACAADVEVYRKAANEKNNIKLLKRAIMSQAVIVAICVGRRAAAVCNMPLDVATEQVEWTNGVGVVEDAVLVRFREMKIRNVDEDVPCPAGFSELVLKAIETARDLTAELRRTSRYWKDFLFIVPDGTGETVEVLKPDSINRYLNGVIQRYSVPVEKITTHNMRHTRATNLWVGGLEVHEVKQDLGHKTADMTVLHYIVGREESHRRFQAHMNHGALSGALTEYIGGGQEILKTKLGGRQVQVMKRQGLVINPNRYGYCALGGMGPCTRAIPCYLGVGVADGGCDHHLLSPDAIPALEEDKATLEAVIETHAEMPEYRVWVQHHLNQLIAVEEALEQARSLQSRLGDCAGSEGCRCQRSDQAEDVR